MSKKLSKTRVRFLQSYGESVAVSTFVSLLNPKNQGSNFKWDKFPLMVESDARKHLFLASCEVTRPSDEEFDYVAEAARDWAAAAIVKAGLVE